MIPPPPKNHRSWDAWLDAFRAANGREAFLDELVAAAQAEALGQPEPLPLTDEELAIVSERNRKVADDPFESNAGPLFAHTEDAC